MENGRSNFRKTKVAAVVLGKKYRAAAGNISGKALFLIERRRGLHMNYPSDRSYENKRNEKKVAKVLK